MQVVGRWSRVRARGAREANFCRGCSADGFMRGGGPVAGDAKIRMAIRGELIYREFKVECKH